MLQVTHTNLPEAISHEDEFSSRIHTAPVTKLDTEDGHDPGDGHRPQLEGGEPRTLGHQGLPLSPATSESSEPLSPTAGFGAYPVAMAPSMLPHESPSEPESMAVNPSYMPGYYAPPFAAAEKAPGYWPSVPHVPPASQFGY